MNLDHKILDLKARNKSFREIALVLGISHSANALVSGVSDLPEDYCNRVLAKKTPYQTIGRIKKPLLHNVHVYQRPSFCLLPSCRKAFQPRKKGKRQLFCCPGHRTEFFRVARRIGAALLIESGSDPHLSALVQSLLVDEIKGRVQEVLKDCPFG